MNPIFLDLGFIQIYWYSIMILVGIILSAIVMLKECKRFNIDNDFMLNLFFYIIPIAIIGARIYFVIFNIDYYSNNFIEIFRIWEGGLAIHGGIIAGLFFIVYYCKKHKQNIWKILDIAVVGLIIGQIIGRWGNFFNQEAYGSVTTLSYLKSLHLPTFIINGMNINGMYYHPTFLYESILNFIGLVILLIIRRKNIKVGQLSSIYLIWYGAVRFFIEILRQDSLMLGNIKVAQLISILMVMIGITIFIKKAKNETVLYNKKEIRNGKSL